MFRESDSFIKILLVLYSGENIVLKDCEFCNKKSKVPEHGQCNKCGFIDGLRRQPSEDEFKHARDINDQHNYAQFKNLDMLLLGE